MRVRSPGHVPHVLIVLLRGVIPDIPLVEGQIDVPVAVLCRLHVVTGRNNGIDEIMINPNNGKTEVIDSIIYSLAEIKAQTNSYLGEIGTDGFVFAGDGAGNFFVLKSDGRIFLYEYYDFSETFYANSLWEFFDKL